MAQLAAACAACLAAPLHGWDELHSLRLGIRAAKPLGDFSGAVLPVDEGWDEERRLPASKCVWRGGSFLLFSPDLEPDRPQGPGRSMWQGRHAECFRRLRETLPGSGAPAASLWGRPGLLGVCAPRARECRSRTAELGLAWRELLRQVPGGVREACGDGCGIAWGHVYARLETTRAVEAVYPPGLQQTGAAFFASLGHENVLGPLQLHSPSMDHVVWRSKCFDLGVREDWLRHRDCCMAFEENRTAPAFCWPGDDQTSVMYRMVYSPMICCSRAFAELHAIVVGFAKSSTSVLMRLLDEHPEIPTDLRDENDGLAGAETVSAQKMLENNAVISRAERRKPGAWLRVGKGPMLAYSGTQMWRLRQVDGLKAIVMVREPMRWLLSLYNHFLLDYHSNTTRSRWCRTHRVPDREGREVCASKLNHTDFWRDVVATGADFTRWNFNRWMAGFSQLLWKNVLPLIKPREIFLLEGAALEIRPVAGAEAILQELAAFLGTRARFPEGALTDVLEKMAASRYNYKGEGAEKREGYRREILCPARREHRRLANSIFAGERAAMWELKVHLEHQGVKVHFGQRMFEPPCDL